MWWWLLGGRDRHRFCWCSRGGSHCIGSQAYLPKKSTTSRVQGGVGLGVSNLGSQCWHSALHWNQFMLSHGGGKWHHQPLCRQREEFMLTVVREALSGEWTDSLCASQMFLRLLSTHCLYSGCWPSWRSIVHLRLYSRQAGCVLKFQTLVIGVVGTYAVLLREGLPVLYWCGFDPYYRPLKFQSLRSASWKNSWTSTPFIFPVNDLGKVFSLCDLLWDPLFLPLSPLSMSWAHSPPIAPMILSLYLLPSVM